MLTLYTMLGPLAQTQPLALPAELVQILGLVLGTVVVTDFLKGIAKRLDKQIAGYGAVLVSFLVAVALSLLAIVMGWYPLELPSFTGNPLDYAQSWLLVAGGITTLANLVYVAVYGKIKSNGNGG